MASSNFDHPLGLKPPDEWWGQQKGHASTAQFNEWLSSTKQKGKPAKADEPKSNSKYRARPGFREDLGFSVRSNLEANFARYLLFVGFALWTGEDAPTEPGKWFRYEGKEFALEDRDKRGNLRALEQYVPDFHTWDNDLGTYEVIECKGYFDRRSKRKIRLMHATYPGIKYTVVTADDLEGMANDALKAQRRHGPMVLQIPHWND